MKHIQDIMTSEVQTLSPESTLLEAEALMREYHIRHVPIIDEHGQLKGLLSQKEFLREAFRITDKFGAQHLQDYLGKATVSSCLDKDISPVAKDMPMKEAGERLRHEKWGCLLITDSDGKLAGIVSSQDFVKLAISLL